MPVTTKQVASIASKHANSGLRSAQAAEERTRLIDAAAVEGDEEVGIKIVAIRAKRRITKLCRRVALSGGENVVRIHYPAAQHVSDKPMLLFEEGQFFRGGDCPLVRNIQT